MTSSPSVPTPIVLAGGPGSRLWPLTRARPKPIVPAAGRPIIEWCLRSLKQAGLERATIVVGHRAEKIQSHLQDGSAIGLELDYVHQDQQLGSAHALATALEAEGMPEAALVLGADNVIEPALVEDLIATGPDAIGVTKSKQPSRYGVVELDGEAIGSLREKPLVEGEALISTGVYLLARGVLDPLTRLVSQGTTDLPGVLARLLESGHEIHASHTTGRWHDAVYPWDLITMTEHLLHREKPREPEALDAHETAHRLGRVQLGEGCRLGPQAIVEGPSSLSANTRLAAGAQLATSLVLDDVKLGRGALVEHSVVGEGATIGAGAVLGAGEAEITTADGQAHQLDRIGAIVGPAATIGPGAVLAPGTIVGAEATIASGARVRGRIPDGGWVT